MSPQPDPPREPVQLASGLLYYCPQYGRGLTPRTYQRLIMQRPWLRSLGWTLRRGSQRDVEQAVRDQSVLAQLRLDDWPAALTNA